MKNPFSYLLRARDKPQNAVSDAPSFYFGMSCSGKSVSPSSAIQVSAVYACVRVIAETIASLPFHVYEATEEGSRKAVEHPLYRLIHDEPNLEMTSFIWRETMLTHLSTDFLPGQAPLEGGVAPRRHQAEGPAEFLLFAGDA